LEAVRQGFASSDDLGKKKRKKRESKPNEKKP